MGQGPESEFSTASKAIKMTMTFTIYYTNFVNGVILNMLSPTVVHYSKKFSTDVSNVSFAFSIISGMYVVGSLICGILFNYISRQPAVVLLVSLVAIPAFIFPWVDNLTPFYILAGLVGLGCGGYDPAQVAWVLDIWRGDAGPYILGQHFAYSIGTVVPPLLVSPFLSDESNSSALASTQRPSNLLIAAEHAIPVEDEYKADILYIPYSIVGSFGALALMIQLVLFVYLTARKRRFIPDPVAQGYKEVLEDGSSDDGGEVNENQPRPSTSSVNNNLSVSQQQSQIPSGGGGNRNWYLILLSCCFIGAYQGMEMSTMQFLPTFAHFSEAKLSEADASQVMSALTLAFAGGRGLGIFLVLKIAPEFLLIGNFVLTAAGGLTLYFAGPSINLLWIGSMLLGLGFSTTYPSYFAYIEKHLFVTDSIAAMMTICGGSVAFVYPFIIGNSVEYNPHIMLYVGLCSLCVVVPVFALVYATTTSSRRSNRQHFE